MKKRFIVLCGVLLFLLSAGSVFAHCPLCTAGIGAAAVSAGYFGLDASIIGVFVGAFGVSTGLWVGRKIKKSYIRFQLPLIVGASFFLTVIPLMGIIGDKLYVPVLWFGGYGSLLNRVYFVDKILFGSILGGITTLSAFWLHVAIKKVNGRVLVPFQGVIVTLLALAASGALLFFYVR